VVFERRVPAAETLGPVRATVAGTGDTDDTPERYLQYQPDHGNCKQYQ